MTSYDARRTANEQSKTAAEHHGEIWEQHELELLEEAWEDDESTLPEVAELLGRTIEACREKHYTIRRGAIKSYRTKQAKSTKNSQWDRGWTSLEDMGF